MTTRLTTDEERQVWLQCLVAAASMLTDRERLSPTTEECMWVAEIADALFDEYQKRINA
jgi:predicted trehalose synthase